MAVANIPVIDISDPKLEEAQVARDLVEAAIKHGFIYIKNTGQDIPIDAVQGAFDLVCNTQPDHPTSVTTCSNIPSSPRSCLPLRQRKSNNAGFRKTTWG
jgi:hypothetical protein